eukprot:1291386-Pleurochrysis_carterae.AAC.1
MLVPLPFLRLCLSPSIWLLPNAGTGAPRPLCPFPALLPGTHGKGRGLGGGAAPCLAPRKPAA